MCYVHSRENIVWNAILIINAKFVMNMSISITYIHNIYIEIVIYSDINQCITYCNLLHKCRQSIILFCQLPILNFCSRLMTEDKEFNKNFLKLAIIFFRIRIFLFGFILALNK